MAKPQKSNPRKEFENLVLEVQKDEQEIDDILAKKEHTNKDHYHGKHHYDKHGKHDHVTVQEFSVRQLFKVNKRLLTFQISATGVILALAVAMSALDFLLEKFSLNIGGVAISMRIFDLMIIILGISVAGFYGSLFIALVEPWFHFLIDPDHIPVQVLFDSLNYMLTVVIFYLIYYAVFKNSLIHKEPNKNRRLFKTITPGILIVTILSLWFSFTFILALIIGVAEFHETNQTNYWVLFFVSLGLQLIRFILMYGMFVVIENKMKPINHRYH